MIEKNKTKQINQKKNIEKAKYDNDSRRKIRHNRKGGMKDTSKTPRVTARPRRQDIFELDSK